MSRHLAKFATIPAVSYSIFQVLHQRHKIRAKSPIESPAQQIVHKFDLEWDLKPPHESYR